jgi:hypothetical protein
VIGAETNEMDKNQSAVVRARELLDRLRLLGFRAHSAPTERPGFADATPERRDFARMA